MSSANKTEVTDSNLPENPEKPKPRTPSSSSEKAISADKENGQKHVSILKSNLPKLIPHKREDTDLRGGLKTPPCKERVYKPKIRGGIKMGDELTKSEDKKKAFGDLKIKKEYMDKIKESKKLKDSVKASSIENEVDIELPKESSSRDFGKLKISKSSSKVEEDDQQQREEDDSNLDFQSCLGIDENTLLAMEGAENKKISEEMWQERQNLIISDLLDVMKDIKEPKFDKMLWMNKTALSSSMLKGKLELRSRKLLAQHEPTTVVGPKYVQDFYDQALREISEVWLNTSSIISAVKDHTQKFFGKKNKSIDKEQLVLEAEMLQLAIDFAIHFSRLRTDFLLKKVKNRLQVKEVQKSDLEKFMESKTLAALYNEEDLSGMARTIKDLSGSIYKEK